MSISKLISGGKLTCLELIRLSPTCTGHATIGGRTTTVVDSNTCRYELYDVVGVPSRFVRACDPKKLTATANLTGYAPGEFADNIESYGGDVSPELPIPVAALFERWLRALS